LSRLPGHQDKSHVNISTLVNFVSEFGHLIERLLLLMANGKNHSSSFGELVDQRLRDGSRGATGQDGVEWGVFRPSVGAIAGSKMNVCIAQSLAGLLRMAGQIFIDFNGINL
jgi:hypothetical protein